VPLSEHEQRLLEEMERALHAEDPQLASTLRHGSQRSINGRQVFLGCVGLLLGLAGLLGGVIASLVVLGVFGFLVMLGGALLISSAFRATGQSKDAKATVAAKTDNGGSSSAMKPNGFMNKVEDRWRRRREQDGF
jgi:uncharacterized membrane protein YedE/YeeE